jgi:hypothetical protein
MPRRALFLVVTFAAVLCALSPFSEAASAHGNAAAWVVDLRASGFPNHENRPGAQEAFRQIAFGSAGEIVVLGAGSLFSELGPVSAFVLEASSGHVLGKTQWTGRYTAYIYPTAEGNYAATTADGLVLYAPGLKEILARSPDSVSRASPDGRSLAAWLQVPGHGLTRFLDTATLRPSGPEFYDENVESVSSRCIATIDHVGTVPGVLVECVEGTRTAFATGSEERQPRFVSDDVLAILGRERLQVIDAGARLLFTAPIRGDASFANASRDGSRFVIVEASLGFSLHGKLRAEKFTVYDVGNRGAIFSTVIKDLRGEEFARSGAALSPDGTALAVNSRGVVRLFHLPRPAAGSS